MPRLAVLALFLIVTAVATGASEVRLAGNVILVPNDETIAPLNHSFNLIGKSLTFHRTGPSSFSEETGPLVFDEDRGTLLTIDRTTRSTTFTIGGFDFPFLGKTVRKLYVSQLLAIYLDVPPALLPTSFWQYTEMDVLAQRTPVIAPFLTTPRGQGSYLPPQVFAKESSDRVVITWFEETRGLAIQAVLFQSGDIRFSYRSIANTHGGSVVISSGDESWRVPSPLLSADDPTNDFGTNAAPGIAGMVDITNVEIGRIAGTNALQATIRVRIPINRSTIAPGGVIAAQVWLGTTQLGVLAGEARFGPASGTPGAAIEGDRITMLFFQDRGPGDAAWNGDLLVTLGDIHGSDSVTLQAHLDAPSGRVRTDFGGIASVATFSGPIQDTFTLPDIKLYGAWNRVKEALNLDATTIDGVAVYENFLTTQVFQAPYADIGNVGVDHISLVPNVSSSLPRAPTVMQLGLIRQTSNASDYFASFLLLHEFGHRWLFSVGNLDGQGGVSDAITGPGLHPAAGLDTRAAFPFRTSNDCSPMGGWTFIDNLNGTFTTASDDSDAGYSWLDLYLMGLAAPEEVPPFFYLEDVDPPLDTLLEGGTTIRATRKDLTIANVTGRMGARSPAYPDTQRVFRVLFVLVYDPEQPLPDLDTASVEHYAELLRDRFAIATGHRGIVVTRLSDPPRRRSVRK